MRMAISTTIVSFYLGASRAFIEEMHYTRYVLIVIMTLMMNIALLSLLFICITQTQPIIPTLCRIFPEYVTIGLMSLYHHCVDTPPSHPNISTNTCTSSIHLPYSCLCHPRVSKELCFGGCQFVCQCVFMLGNVLFHVRGRRHTYGL